MTATFAPLANNYHNLVYSQQGGDADMAMLAGRILAGNGQLIHHDLQSITAEINHQAPQQFSECG